MLWVSHQGIVGEHCDIVGEHCDIVGEHCDIGTVLQIKVLLSVFAVLTTGRENELCLGLG